MALPEQQPTNEQGVEAEDLKQELSSDEIKEQFSALKEKYCAQLGEKAGVKVIFPEGTVIGDIDVSGQSLAEVLDLVIDPLENYEPPLLQEQLEGQSEKKPDEIPIWLRGHEGFIWRRAHENPIWQTTSSQYGKEVVVSYERRGQKLKPGKSRYEQKIELEGADNTFTLDEWRVAKQIFADYEGLENDIKSGDLQTRKEAKAVLLEIIKEENAFRKGAGDASDTILNKINELINEVAKRTRGFKKENIDAEALSQKIAELLSQLVVLNYTRGDGREKVPTVKPDIKEIPSFEHSLSLLANNLDTQLKADKGMTLMIGEAGVGKNEAVEYLAAKTNRPFFWFPCGRGMEAIDLVAHYEFDTKEGTKRFLTDLAEGIQTPGAVVMIDEVNALKPEVQAVLHGLGDSNRSLNYDGVQIPVAEGAVVIIAGNPATYGSAGDIGQALLSRTRGQSMVMEYPALTKGKLEQQKNQWSDAVLEQKEQENNELKDYACDEVRVLYPLLEEFSNLNDEEFELMWDVVINEPTQGSNIVQVEKNSKLELLLKGPASEQTRKTLIDLRDILRVANTWREYYEQRKGEFDIIGVSIRDTIAVTQAYIQERDVRKAYLRVMNDFKKEPIEGLSITFKALSQLIEDTLGTEDEDDNS